jgi:hypothetical protein
MQDIQSAISKIQSEPVVCSAVARGCLWVGQIASESDGQTLLSTAPVYVSASIAEASMGHLVALWKRASKPTPEQHAGCAFFGGVR